jgi:PiT family inorganic phosphate transporter
VLSNLDPTSALAVALLIFALLMVIMFEATNGFHDAANAVATVIYSKSLRPAHAVVWSGVMNFLGVLLGGIAVAYAIVELLPAEVLSPPDGGPAVAMLVALFVAALVWNIGTWWLGLPNSSSHCLIGALMGVALGNAFARSRTLSEGVHWRQIGTVLEALALSPLLGFLFAGGLYVLMRKVIHEPQLYQPAGDRPPVWWMRAILIATCSGVSFAHGTNDGQKSIGLIMLTIIGLFPAAYALNPAPGGSLGDIAGLMRAAQPLIRQYGDREKDAALAAAQSMVAPASAGKPGAGSAEFEPEARVPPGGLEFGLKSELAKRRASIRDDVYRVIAQMRHVSDVPGASAAERQRANQIAKHLGATVEYAPLWVRALSAVCLGLGTMFGYRRIVTTLGERLGTVHLTPAQGGATEVVSTLLIGLAGFTGLPVSTTHIVTAGIGGTMIGSGAGLRYGMLSRIVLAWVFTLPITTLIAGALYVALADPRM